MNWIKRLFSKKETTKQCDIHVVMQSLPKRLSNRAYRKAKTLRYDEFVKWWDEQV